MGSSVKAYLALFGVIIMWSPSYAATKHILEFCSPMVTTWLRLAIAVAGFLVFYPGWRKIKPAAGDLKWLIGLGLLEPCLYFVFESNALKLTTSSQAGAISALYPPLTALFAALILKERLGIRAMLGFGLALAGAVGLSLLAQESQAAPRPLLGNFLELAAMCCGALCTIGLKRLAPQYPGAFLAFVTIGTGFVFFSPLALFSLLRDSPGLPGSALLALLYLGLGVSMCALGLFGYALRYIPAAKVAGWCNLMPLTAILLGWLILGEAMTSWQYFLAALIIIGALVSQQDRRG